MSMSLEVKNGVNFSVEAPRSFNFKEMKKAALGYVKDVLRRHPTRDIQLGRATARSDRSKFR